MTDTNLKRFFISCLGYALLVLISAYSFEWFRHSAELGLIPKQTFSVIGPTLALFTHMSIFLFVPLTMMVLGASMLWVFKPNLRWISLTTFITLWLASGWWMYDLF